MIVDRGRRLLKPKYPRLWNFLRALRYLVSTQNLATTYLTLHHFVRTQKFVSTFIGPLYLLMFRTPAEGRTD